MWLERENRVDIVTNFYSVNGNHMNLSSIPSESKDINWMHLIRGLFNAVRYLHEKVKVLHNGIKSNNVVLDGCSITEAEAVLIDFGKATHQISPKIYHKPADTKKYKHLAPELGEVNGKQSKETDVYSLGYLMRGLNYKFQNFPSIFIYMYRSCMGSKPSRRPSANELCRWDKLLISILIKII